MAGGVESRRQYQMIRNDQEFEAMLERVRHFQRQVTHLRQVESNPANYRRSASGYLAELDRMNLEIREYLWLHGSELTPQKISA